MYVNGASELAGATQHGAGLGPKALGQLAENFASLFDKADGAAAGFAAGQLDTQSVVEALSQAELALQTAITVRDRVVSAYQDILRMPI